MMNIYDRIKGLEPDDYPRFLGWYGLTKKSAQRFRDEKPQIYEAMIYTYNLLFDPEKVDKLHKQVQLPGICKEREDT